MSCLPQILDKDLKVPSSICYPSCSSHHSITLLTTCCQLVWRELHFFCLLILQAWQAHPSIHMHNKIEIISDNNFSNQKTKQTILSVTSSEIKCTRRQTLPLKAGSHISPQAGNVVRDSLQCTHLFYRHSVAWKL